MPEPSTVWALGATQREAETVDDDRNTPVPQGGERCGQAAGIEMLSQDLDEPQVAGIEAACEEPGEGGPPSEAGTEVTVGIHH